MCKALQEPTKAEQLAFERDGKYPTRMASVIMTKPPKSYPIELELNLEEGSVVSYKTVRAPAALCLCAFQSNLRPHTPSHVHLPRCTLPQPTFL